MRKATSSRGPLCVQPQPWGCSSGATALRRFRKREGGLIVCVLSLVGLLLSSTAGAITPTNTANPTPTRTSTNTRTPTPEPYPCLTVEGLVLGTGPGGLVAAGARVTFRSCDSTLASCSPYPGSVWTDPEPVGHFEWDSSWYEDEPDLVTGEVSGTELRNVLSRWEYQDCSCCSGRCSYCASTFVTVDPMSEAAMRLMEASGLGNYDVFGAGDVVEAVRNANAETSFVEMSVEEAVQAAYLVASNDTDVQDVLATSLLPPTYTRTPATPSPTPTITTTPTATATLTYQPTATPRSCQGDCNGDASVTVDELVLAVAIALGETPSESCPAYGGVPVIVDLMGAVVNSLEGCPSLSPLPDLVPVVGRLDAPFGCLGAGTVTVEVCVANVGDAPAGPFAVVLNDGADGFDVPGLDAGEGWCESMPLLSFPLEVVADPEGVVVESVSTNNSTTYETDPLLLRTCTPTPSPSPTPT